MEFTIHLIRKISKSNIKIKINMASLNLFSKLKQNFKELVSKEARTQDAAQFLERLKKMEEDEKRITRYLNNVKMFIEASAE